MDLDLGMNMGGERLPRVGARPSSRPRNPKDRHARGRGIVGIPGSSEGSWIAPGSIPGSVPRDRRVVGRGTARPIPGQSAARAKPINRNAKRLLVYVLDVAATQSHNQVVIDLARRQRKPTGEWGPLRPWWYAPRRRHVKYDPEDRLLLALLDEAHHGTSSHGAYAGGSTGNGTATSTSTPEAWDERPATCVESAGSCSGRTRQGSWSVLPRPAACGSGGPRAKMIRRRCAGTTVSPGGSRWISATEAGGKRWAWRGALRRGDHRMDLSEPLVLLPGLLSWALAAPPGSTTWGSCHGFSGSATRRRSPSSSLSKT